MTFTVAAISSLFFAQTDLSHTVFSSYSLLQGHFTDFYDFNKPLFVGNDYLIVLYVVVALWMSPIYFLGLGTSPADYSALLANEFELLWAKLALILLLLLCATIVQRIVRNHLGSPGSKREFWLMLSSPFAIFPVAVMGQYDIIGLTLALLGLEAWLSKRYFAFVGIFAFAISFKYLAFAIFIPLLLLGAKSLRQAFLWLLIALVPIGVQLLAFSSNEAFRSNVLRQPMGLILAEGSLISPGFLLRMVGALALLGLSIWLVRKKFESNAEEVEFALISILFSLSVLFIAVRWNPQWLIYLVPFWVFVSRLIPQRKILWLIEALGFLGLVWMLASPWANNLDDAMALRGPLSFLLPDRVLRLGDFFPSASLLLGVVLAHLAIVAPIALALLSLRRKKTAGQVSVTSTSLENLFVTLRPISFAAFFLVPVLLCFVAPVQIANTISEDVDLNNLSRQTGGQIHSETLELKPNHKIVQSFISEGMTSQALSLDVSTLGASISGQFELEVKINGFENRRYFANLKEIRDSSFPGFSGWALLNFRLEDLVLPKGSKVELSIRNQSSHPIAIFADRVRPESVTLITAAGESVPGALVMAFLNATR